MIDNETGNGKREMSPCLQKQGLKNYAEYSKLSQFQTRILLQRLVTRHCTKRTS